MRRLWPALDSSAAGKSFVYNSSLVFYVFLGKDLGIGQSFFEGIFLKL
jgi:hypothetical protein